MQPAHQGRRPVGEDRESQIGLDEPRARWVELRIQPQLSVFNTLNNRAVFGVRSMNYLTSSYLQPATVLQPRLVRLEAQIKW